MSMAKTRLISRATDASRAREAARDILFARHEEGQLDTILIGFFGTLGGALLAFAVGHRDIGACETAAEAREPRGVRCSSSRSSASGGRAIYLQTRPSRLRSRLSMATPAWIFTPSNSAYAPLELPETRWSVRPSLLVRCPARAPLAHAVNRHHCALVVDREQIREEMAVARRAGKGRQLTRGCQLSAGEVSPTSGLFG
jgi:hypothetical protein